MYQSMCIIFTTYLKTVKISLMKLKLTLDHSKDLLRVGSGVQLECAGLKTLKKGYSEIFC